MSFIKLDAIPQQEKLPGCHVRFVHSENMTLSYWKLDQGAKIPNHAHPHEQVTSLIEGRMAITVGDETRVISAGEVAVIPSNTPHAVTAETECRVIDVFYPVREDYR